MDEKRKGQLRRPQPIPSLLTKEFWAATREKRLVLQRCTACARFRHPPTPVCPYCNSTGAAWDQISGSGTVYAFSIMYRALVDGFDDHLPLTCVGVTPDEDAGVCIVGNLIDENPRPVAIGQAVRVYFEPIDDGLFLPNFSRVQP